MKLTLDLDRRTSRALAHEASLHLRPLSLHAEWLLLKSLNLLPDEQGNWPLPDDGTDGSLGGGNAHGG